jgi:hypothetical protein
MPIFAGGHGLSEAAEHSATRLLKYRWAPEAEERKRWTEFKMRR